MESILWYLWGAFTLDVFTTTKRWQVERLYHSDKFLQIYVINLRPINYSSTLKCRCLVIFYLLGDSLSESVIFCGFRRKYYWDSMLRSSLYEINGKLRCWELTTKLPHLHNIYVDIPYRELFYTHMES